MTEELPPARGSAGRARWLILRPGALGDTLLALPALALLRGSHPGIEVHMAGNPRVFPLLEPTSLVDGLLDFSDRRLVGLFSAGAPIGPELRRLLERFSSAVLWCGDPDGCIGSRLREAGIRDVRGGDPKSQEFGDLHMTRRLSRLLRLAGDTEPDLRSAALARAAIPRALPAPPSAVLHPGSGGASKCWPLEGFAAVGRELIDSGFRVAIVTGPAEGRAGEELRRLVGSPDRVSAERLEAVGDLAALLASCDLYVGNDSGPSHLAAALGVRCVAIFGPTDPRIWAPCGPRVAVLGGGGSWPQVAEVLGEVRRIPAGGSDDKHWEAASPRTRSPRACRGAKP